MFSNSDLKRLLIPLMIEQFLSVLVGMIDVAMVGAVGQAAMSGVSLVDTVNFLLIQILAALTTGGAVVAGQALGAGDRERACKAGDQLLFAATVFSTVIMVFCLLGNYLILHGLFGTVEADVMKNARIYLYITALSFPFLAVYNSCAALYRTMGNSKISMKTSAIMNSINVVGNAIGVYILKAGVYGVAIPTLIARIFAAVLMLYIIRDPKNTIHINRRLRLGCDLGMIRQILNIGIPAGMENGMFQFGRLMVQSIVSTMGTSSMAAFSAASSIVKLMYLPGSAISLGMVTVVSRCVGAGEYGQARHNVIKLVSFNYLILIVIVPIITALRVPLVELYSLTGETLEIGAGLVLYHGFAMILWPVAFCLPHALRAASDVTFTMVISVGSMWVFRIGCAYLFTHFLGFPVLGVWIAMSIDWVFRFVLFIWRFMSGKWLEAKKRSLT